MTAAGKSTSLEAQLSIYILIKRVIRYTNIQRTNSQDGF